MIREYKKKSQLLVWPLLFGIAVLVHLYFVAMLIPLRLLTLYFRYRKSIKKWTVLLDIFLVIVVVYSIGYCIGLFSIHLNDLQNHEYGYFSWNLNGFLNPSSSSTFLDGLSFGPGGQYEGYSYLGLGNLLLLPIALVFFLEKDTGKHKSDFIIPFGIISFLYILFAASNRAFLNSGQIWYFNLPDRVIEFFSVFRASGRFIWPVFYMIVIFGLVSLIRNMKYPSFFLILVILIQIIDIQPHYAAKRLNRFIKYESPLQSEFWEAAKTNEHIILIPADDSAINTYEPIAIYARENQMTLNWGYFARSNELAMQIFVEDIIKDLETGMVDVKTIYVFHQDAEKSLAETSLSDNLVLCDIDYMLIAFSPDNKLVNTYNISNANCSVP